MTLTAVLFVGGESRRMGVDKATLTIAGEPLWARQLTILRELKPQALRVSARTRPSWCPAELNTVLDAPPSRGPLSGLSAALESMTTTHLLALAVDLPRMTSAHLQKLWSLAGPECGVIPERGGEFEPLAAIYPGGEFVNAAVRAALGRGDYSLQNLAQVLFQARRLQKVLLTGAEQDCYLNWNRRGEFGGEGAEAREISRRNRKRQDNANG